ncbi:hypothetical protein SLS62_010184 [Diatrype stigma]|uniref:Uncharacterized protein n=1 Tax=Diatrype stigma TaxID=117547 RepID=A0AAN9YIN7_9PEZI
MYGLGNRSSPSRPSSEQEERNGLARSSAIPNSPSVPPSPSPSIDRIAAASSPKVNSTSGLGVSSPANDDLYKRRRVGILASTTGNVTTVPSTPSSFVARLGLPSKEKRAGGISLPAPEPKFCPGDRDQLIRRLATFQELTEWMPKPDKLNEIEWAKRGWVCQGKERVRCTLCNKELVVQTSARREAGGKEDGVSVTVSVTVDAGIQEAVVNKFAELIVEAHSEDCLWRKRACDGKPTSNSHLPISVGVLGPIFYWTWNPTAGCVNLDELKELTLSLDALLRLPLSNPQTALASLRERYDDLATRPSFLPYLFNLRLPEHLDLQAAKAQLPADFFTEPPPPSPAKNSSTAVNDVALALALAGWQGLNNPRIGPVPNSASCATCLRRLGLWMFKSKEVDEATGEILVPAPMDHLDPVREHRFFCPWRNPSAQKNPASKVKENKAGWEVLAQTLKNTSYLRGQAAKSSRPRIFHRSSASVPVTPSKGAAGANSGSRDDASGVTGGGDRDQQGVEGQGDPSTPNTDVVAASNEEEDPAVRDAKDKERWARLRRVKSLFDTKNGKRLRRNLSRPSSIAPASRPGTAHGGEDPDAAAAAEENGTTKAA